jgi:thiamine pyrophosphokinase
MSNVASDTHAEPASISGPVNPQAGIVDRTLNASARRFEWHPARLLQPNELHEDSAGATKTKSVALVILNQPITNVPALGRLFRNTAPHVCADGGANRLLEVRGTASSDGFIDCIDAIVGDLDSVSLDTLRYYGTSRTREIPTVVHDPDQYSTDFQKSVCYIRYKWPVRDIAVWGGLGGRVDQAMSQLHHLFVSSSMILCLFSKCANGLRRIAE